MKVVAKEVFNILRSYDYTVHLYDDEGNRVTEPDEARRMFAAPENLLVSILDDGDNSGIRVYLGKRTKIGAVDGLTTTLRMTAAKYNLLFNLRRYGHEIAPKDFATHHSVSEASQGFGNMNELTEGMYGTSRSSYLKLPHARMIVRHSDRIDSETPGARGRKIESVFCENAAGERFKMPTNGLAPGRAMTQHLSQGGKFNDEVGEGIVHMASESSHLSHASRHVTSHKKSLKEDAFALREMCREKVQEHRQMFNRLFKPSTYAEAAKEIRDNVQMLNEDDDGRVTPEMLEEVRKLLACEGAEDLPEAVIEACVRCKMGSKPQTESLDEDTGFYSGDSIRDFVDSFTDTVKRDPKEAARTLRSLIARYKENPKPRVKSLIQKMGAVLKQAETKPLGETREASPPTVSVLGRQVNAVAWNDLKAGKIELKSTPDIGMAGGDQRSGALKRLRAIAGVCTDDSMATLLADVAHRLEDDQFFNSDQKKALRAVAGAAIRAAGLAPSETTAMREYREWVTWLDPLREGYPDDFPFTDYARTEKKSLASEAIIDQLVEDFAPEDYLEDPNGGEDAFYWSRRYELEEDEKTFTMDGLISSLQHWLETKVEEAEMLIPMMGLKGEAAELAEQVAQTMKTAGYIEDDNRGYTSMTTEGTGNDDIVLTREDVLLPSGDMGDDLRGEVMTNDFTNDPPSGDELARMRQLAGL